MRHSCSRRRSLCPRRLVFRRPVASVQRCASQRRAASEIASRSGNWDHTQRGSGDGTYLRATSTFRADSRRSPRSRLRLPTTIIVSCRVRPRDLGKLNGGTDPATATRDGDGATCAAASTASGLPRRCARFEGATLRQDDSGRVLDVRGHRAPRAVRSRGLPGYTPLSFPGVSGLALRQHQLQPPTPRRWEFGLGFGSCKFSHGPPALTMANAQCAGKEFS